MLLGKIGPTFAKTRTLFTLFTKYHRCHTSQASRQEKRIKHGNGSRKTAYVQEMFIYKGCIFHHLALRQARINDSQSPDQPTLLPSEPPSSGVSNASSAGTGVSPSATGTVDSAELGSKPGVVSLTKSCARARRLQHQAKRKPWPASMAGHGSHNIRSPSLH